jgi:alanine dehydrogenase
MKKQYSLGFISRSQSTNEMYSPIWYKHLTEETLKNSFIKEYIFEQDFGSYTFSEAADDYLMKLGCKVIDRFSLLNSSDIVISLKPTDEWEYMSSGSTLVSWFNHLKSLPKNFKNINFLDLEEINILAEGRQQKLL